MKSSGNRLKKFIINYYNAFSSGRKSPELCDRYMTDQGLKEHILFFDTIFPDYEVFADEITVEGNRAVVRARLKGIHKGEFMGIPPTYKDVDMPFAIGYTIEDNMITNHWMIADQVSLMQQLGIEMAAEH